MNTSSSGASGTRSRDPRLIEAANIAYHEAEASLYDQSHPEILWCERPHWETFGKRHLSAGHHPTRIIDIGAGTGFIGDVLSPFLNSVDTYVAVDLSKEMLDRLQQKFSGVSFKVECIPASAGRVPLPDGTADMVMMNSALHHVPDPNAVLDEMSRLVKPGGLLVIMHEPNIRFARSPFFRQVARAASVLASRIDPASKTPRVDYAPVFLHVNTRLIEQGLIASTISSAEIQALVDVHSPTARGRYEEVGFDPHAWIRSGPFNQWNVVSFETYNFLGKLDPTARLWRRVCNQVLARISPRSGSLFSLVLQKPTETSDSSMATPRSV